MDPTLDLHRRWQLTYPDSDPPRQVIDDYTAHAWECPTCHRRLDKTECWTEPVAGAP